MHQPLLRFSTRLDLRFQVLEHQVLTTNFFAIAFAAEFRPVPLVLRFGGLFLGPIRIAKQRRHQLLRRSRVPIDRVHTADARHLFLVRLLALGAMSAGRLLLDGSHHRNAFVIFGDDQQRALFFQVDRPLAVAKHRCRLRHLLIGAFQRVHRLWQPKDRLNHLTHLPERLLDTQQLIPFLQQIRHLAGRQLQTLIGRGELDLRLRILRIDPA